jgi:hypothetical protein
MSQDYVGCVRHLRKTGLETLKLEQRVHDQHLMIEIRIAIDRVYSITAKKIILLAIKLIKSATITISQVMMDEVSNQ